MKKYILVFAFIWLSFVSPVYAQTATEAKQDAYQTALVQLINLLQAQVKLLMDQLVAVQASQTALTTQVTQIEKNTTPTPMFGSVEKVIAANVETIEVPKIRGAYCNNAISLSNQDIDTGKYSYLCTFFPIYSINGKEVETGTIKMLTGSLNQDSEQEIQKVSLITRSAFSHIFTLRIYDNNEHEVTFKAGNAEKTITVGPENYAVFKNPDTGYNVNKKMMKEIYNVEVK